MLGNGLPKADVTVNTLTLTYLEHFPKCSVSQLPNDFPDFLRVHVSVYMFILLLPLVRPQLEYFPKIEEGHLFGRELQRCRCGLFRQENIAVPSDAELKWLTKYQHPGVK